MRKRRAEKRSVSPDTAYKSEIVSQLINKIMERGKKSVAEHIVYSAFDKVKTRAKDEPLKVFTKALDNIAPKLEVKSRRVGGATYQVPVEVSAERGRSLALRWISMFAKKRNEKEMSEKLAGEILDAASNKGASIKKREDLQRMAEANRAFAHYRW